MSLASLFHHAALDPAHWLPALQAMASATRSLRGQLIGIGGPDSVPFNWATSLEQSIADDFVAIGGGDPRVNFRVAAGGTAAVGQILAERDYAPHRDRLGDNVYEEFCRRHDLPLGCQTVLRRENDAMIGLALLRSRQDGETTPEQQASFAALAPHVAAAVDLQMAIESRGAALTSGALEAIDAPALLIDAYGRVASVTPAADRAIRVLPHLDIVDGHLFASGSGGEALQAALGDVLARRVPRAELVLQAPAAMPLRLTLHRLEATEWSFGFVPRAIVLLRHRSAARGEAARQLLSRTYGLTAAEAEIAVALGRGEDRRAIAERRGALLGTLRQQIKAIYAKTGVNREAALVALLTSLDL